MKKLFDLRFVIGLFFLSIGILLTGYHFMIVTDSAMHPTVNKWSGLVYLIFGAVMVRLSYLKRGSGEE